MSAVVADTHTILWYLAAAPELSERAREAMEKATADGEPIFIPTICFVEATFLTERNRVPALQEARSGRMRTVIGMRLR